MNLAELERKLIAAARANPPSDQVPYAFEKRIMARLAARPAMDHCTLWARALWRAAAPCVAIMLLLGAWSFFDPPASSPATDLSQQLETDPAGRRGPGSTRRFHLVNSWKVILATMVIFGTGVVTGGLLVQHAGLGREHRQPRPSGAVHPAQPTPAGLMRTDFLRRMQGELDLTPEQHEQIDKILKEGQQRTKKLMEIVEPRRREEYKRTLEEFRAVLTPEQRKRLDGIVKQQQQRAREQRKAAPPHERPPATNTPAATNSASTAL